MPPSPPPVAVLTGGVGSGKTTVSDRLAALGAVIVDTDLIARQLVRPGQPGLLALCERFGTGILTPAGELDRQAMRLRAFAVPEVRQQLEHILHPLIESEARSQLAALSGSPYAVLVVPLLVETGLFADLSPVIVVDTPEQLQLERLMQRDEISETQARQMLQAQASRQARLSRADHVLHNSGSRCELIEQVDQLHADLLNRFETTA